MVGRFDYGGLARRSGLLGVAVVALMALGGCNKPSIQTTEAYVGGRMPRPDHVMVAAFAVTPDDVRLDQGVAARMQRSSSDVPLTGQQLQVARAAQAELADALVQALRGYGLPAERAWGDVPPAAGSALLVEGQIVSVDQGNRTRRTLVGLGAGKSSLSADMQLYLARAPERPRFLTAFSGSDDSGHTPGLAEGMGVGAAGGHLLASTAIGSALHLHSETHGATGASEASKLAQGLAVQIGQFAVSQGWIPPDAVR
ncbi:MAG: DUF4410 domain-containing protein [Acetobacteraceae bacterium]|nr:DUF4410 domain-containing protein [Acetobacteraceae bacterium]